MKALDWKLLAAVLIFAGIFRFWAAFDYADYIGDEVLIVPAAKSLVTYGTTSEWKYPQINGIIIACTIRLFGDNPVGWRVSGSLLGTASVLLVYLIAHLLYADTRISVLAASILAFDPFNIYFCRVAMIETPVVFFFLLFLYLILEHTEKNRQTLTLAGIAMGLTIATKAYFVFAIPVVIVFSLFRDHQANKNNFYISCFEYIIKLALLPLAVYLFSYIFWFGRGYSFKEFFEFRYDAYWLFNNNYKFLNEEILAKGGKPWEWFLKPILYGNRLITEGEQARYEIEINNPLFRLMVFPALFIVLINGVKQRIATWFLAPALFVSCYLLFFMTNRVFNSYSALVLLPFAYLTLAHAVVFSSGKYNRATEVTILFFCVAFLLGWYLFPLTAGFLVTTSYYEPILSITKLIRTL